MKNWNTDTAAFPSTRAKRVWELSQLINYGFDGEKVSKSELIAYWPELRGIIDPEKRRLFELLLWGKHYSLPVEKTSFFRQNEIRSLPIPTT